MSPLTALNTNHAALAVGRRDLNVPAAGVALAASRRDLRVAAGVQATWLRERPGLRRPV